MLAYKTEDLYFLFSIKNKKIVLASQKNALDQTIIDPGCALKQLAPTSRKFKNFDQELSWCPCHFFNIFLTNITIIFWPLVHLQKVGANMM